MRISEEVRKFLSTIGKAGGEQTSDAKTKAARENAKLGGRPRKTKTEGTPEQIRMRLWRRNQRAAIKSGKEWRVRKRKRSNE